MKSFVWFEDLDGILCCPECGKRVDVYYIDKEVMEDPESFEPEYCPKCGKHLDWSETRSYGVKESH